MTAKAKKAPAKTQSSTPRFFKDRFDGKVVIITGGASGLGKETALRIAREGGKLALVDLKQEALDEATADIAKVAPKAEVLTVAADVSKEAEVGKSASASRTKSPRSPASCSPAMPASSTAVITIDGGQSYKY